MLRSKHAHSGDKFNMRKWRETSEAADKTQPMKIRINMNIDVSNMDQQTSLTAAINARHDKQRIEERNKEKTNKTPAHDSNKLEESNSEFLNDLWANLDINEPPKKKYKGRETQTQTVTATTTAWKKSKRNKKIMENTASTKRNASITDFFNFTQTSETQRVKISAPTSGNTDIINIFTLNTQQGITYKIHDVMEELELYKIDVALITETGLNATTYRDKRTILTAEKKGYKIISGPYLDNKASHLLFIIKKEIDIKSQVIYKTGRMIAVEVQTAIGPIHIMGVYHAHDNETKNKTNKEIKEWHKKHGSNKIILGDFNELAQPQDSTSLDKTGNKIHIQKYSGPLHHKLNKWGMIDLKVHLNGDTAEHTHIQETSMGTCKSRLDYIYGSTEMAEICTNFSTLYGSTVKTDHIPIMAGIATKATEETQDKKTRSNPRTKNPKNWTKWRDEVHSKIGGIVEDERRDQNNKSTNDELLQKFNSIITTAAEAHLRADDAQESPYTYAIRDSIEAQQAKKRAQEEWINWKKGISRTQEALKKADKQHKLIKMKIIHEVQKEQWRKNEKRIAKNNGDLFKLLRNVGKKAQRVTDRPNIVATADGNTTSDPKIVADTFQKEWNKLYSNATPEKEEGIWLQYTKKGDYGHILKQHVDMETLRKKIKKLKNDKSAGEDEIYNEYLKHLDDDSLDILRLIINDTITHGSVPAGWRSSVTTMLHKKGDKTDPMNYRPITLLNCAYKVYSSIQTDRLNHWINEHHIINENQFGFRTGRDTSDAALRLFACISNAMSTNKWLHIIFLDIAKAYDSVQHWALRQTLHTYGLSKEDVHLIMDMVTGYSTKLMMSEGTTDNIDITAGLRQGDGLSPILYSLFLNPLLEWIQATAKDSYQIGSEKYNGGAYADDMSLISHTKEGIVQRMEMVQTFMTHNDININTSKSSYHWRGEATDKADITYKGEKLDEQGEYGLFTYLGWTTNLHLNWKPQIEILTKKYVHTVNLTLKEKGLLLDQKIRVLNAIANASIAYRTRLMYDMDNEWLSRLDKWVVKKLNKTARLAPQTDKAYWYMFRGLKNLYTENTAAFINHTVERILNDDIATDALRAYTIRGSAKCFLKHKIHIAEGRTDLIETVISDKNIVKALLKGDIRYASQMLNNGIPMNISQFDKLDLDAPGSRQHMDNDPYEGWGREVVKKIRQWHRATTEEETHEQVYNESLINIYTDGSLKQGRATYSAVIGDNNTQIGTGSTVGRQEINNAELQAIINGLHMAQNVKHIHVYSDSLNCVRFANNYHLLSRRQINKSQNAESKLRLQNIIQQRTLNGATTAFYHVRSHANDNHSDASKRKQQNKDRFADRAPHIENMNDLADKAANLHAWNNVPYSLLQCTRKYVTTIQDVVTLQHPGRSWRDLQYDKYIADWKRRQPIRTAFLHEKVDAESMPKKFEAYANLTCKILTGTMWTAKLKKRLRLTDTDECKLCATHGVSVIEDAAHTIGGCKSTQLLNDNVWKEIKLLGAKYKLHTENWMPWFSTTTHHSQAYAMPVHIGDKGLMPKEFSLRVYNENQHIPRRIIKIKLSKISRFWKWAVRTNYFRRFSS